MRFGEGSIRLPSAEGPPPDSELLQVEWWAIPPTGSPFVLHEATDFDIADISGSRGSISVAVPLGTATHDALYAATVAANRDIEVEIRLFGGTNQALGGFLQEADGDDVAETGVRRWSGCLLAGLVYESRLPPNAGDPKGETLFVAKNAGQMIATLVQAAQARSELPGVTIATFSTAQDSLGNSWADLTSNITLSPGASLGEILDDFTERGLCEWDMSRTRELRLYVPEARGTDRTVGPFADLTVLHRGRDLFDAPRKWSVRDAPTDILVAGKEGLYQTATDASARARRGRKIVAYASDGQVDNASALQAYAQNKLATLTPGAVELSHGLVVNGPGPRPFTDINVGDWVWSDTGSPTGPERLRVQQVQLSRSGDELKAVAVVGTLSMSAIVMLARKLARMERGTTVVGTSVDPATGGVDDIIPPAAPIGLVASSIAYQDSQFGETLARIDLSWQAVTTDARGDISPQAQAAQLILDRIESGATILDDWTWSGSPALVGTHNDTLLAAYELAGHDDPLELSTAKTWLQDYINTAEQSVGDPTVTDDVAGYRVRYAYVGLNQIGGIPSSDPFEGDTLAYYSATDDTGTTATTYSWGGVGAGREVRLQVAAFDRAGNQSVWSAPLVITTAADNLPPAITSTPTVTPLFASVQVTWDGLTVDGIDMRTAAPDFSHVEVHLSPALDFTPDLSTYQANLAAGGTWQVNDLAYGVGYFARLVAVDLAGNPSAPSASGGPATPAQLVNIDIGPDAISRVQIIDGEIVTAKIADLAVNDAKIAALSVGKLTTGTMTAAVTLSGIIRTALTGARTEIDAAGVRLYNTAGVNTVNLSALTGNALVIGTYMSGLSGERIHIDPDGSLRLYPVAGTNFSSISNFGNDVVWRGPLDPNGRSGRVNVNVLGVGLNYSSEAEIPSNLRAEVGVFDRRVRVTAPLIHLQANGKLSNADGTPRRVQFSTTNASGVDVGASFIAYRMASSGSGGMSGNGAGWKCEAGQLLVCGDDDLNSFGVIKASEFAPASSRELKTDIAPLPARLGRAIDIARRLRPVTFSYREDAAPPGQHIGLIAEEVGAVAPDLVIGADRPAREHAVSVMGVATVALGAAADNARDLDGLRARVAALEARRDRDDGDDGSLCGA